MSFEPLNPGLYRLLEKEFDGDVLVAGEGASLQGTYDNSSRRKAVAMARDRREQEARNERPSLTVDYSGEEYRVNCPFCNDTRHRLFINHRWGVKDDYGNRNLWLAHCWNEECLANYTTQRQLWDRVFRCGRRPPSGETIRPGLKVDMQNLGKAVPPGAVIRLDELRRKNPNHQAITYLEERGFDCDSLAKMYDVGYCPNSRYPLAADRIYVPIFMEDVLRGWQMRMTRDWKSGDPPKYWSMPNMKRRLLAYNFDRATKYKTPVIVEGPADVWSCGEQSMGCIGKTMNPALIQRLLTRCRDGSVIVMLDPAPDSKAKEKLGDRYVHHIEKLAAALSGTHGFVGGVVRVYLPEGSDPGSLEPDFMRDYIRDAAKQQQVKISFKKRS